MSSEEAETGSIPIWKVNITPKMRKISQTGQMRFMPEKLDSDYMKAVESGDVEAQQRMVDEAAKMAGWNVIPVSHGSGAQFNEFKREFLGTATGGKSANEAFFFTNSPKTSRNYATYAAEEGPIKELLRKADEAEKKGDWDAYEKFLTEAEDASYGELGAEAAAKRRENAKVYNVYLKGKFMELDAEGKTPEELSATKDLSEFDGSLTAAIKKAKKDGYDGVVFRNLDDAPNISDPSDHYAVIDPKAIKLSDPITRDDSGNVIPLSKRFDVGSRDMRYMPEGDGSINLMKQTNLGGDASMIMSAKWGTPKQTSQSVALSDKPENHIVGLSRIKGLLKAKDLSDKQKSSLEDFLVKTASFATDSPGFRDLGTPTNKEEALTIISKVTDRMARNLLSIYDAVPPPIRSYWQRWYPLAYDWNKAQSAKHKITRQVVAGINARLSPGKDWIHNVNMTERILSSFADDVSMTQEIADGAMPIIDNALETKLNSKENKNKPKAWIDEQKAKVNAAKQEVQNLVGMKLSEMTDAQAAQLIRYHTQVVGDNKVLNYFEQGNPVYADAISWQSFSNLEKAINMYRDPSMENISNNMGSDHKIRSFFNNQESPNDNVLRDVTSDTHAVAAAYLLPLSQSSQQVARNFGGSSNAVSGLNGMYYIVADAYRKAADARNVEPRAMQSITWEGARSMFPRGFKKAENVKKVEAIWNRFEKRELTKQQALQEINKLLIDFFAKNPNSRPRFAVLPR